MRRIPSAVLAVLFTLAASLVLISCVKKEAIPPPAAVSDADQVGRGKYLVTILGCNDCHTPGYFYGAPDTARTLAGSELGWKGPWGVTYPRNLTPEPQTGIGAWSDSDIVTAIRTGKRPDGRILLPPMPWPDLAALSDDDATAIAKYLKTLPPVPHNVPDIVPPGSPVKGSYFTLPAPSAWDKPKTPPAAPPATP
jgi:mono/diheme cytochrome c family protein